MCDAVVAVASVNADGITLFRKNSDREPNEARHSPAADYPSGSTVKCTFIEQATQRAASPRPPRPSGDGCTFLGLVLFCVTISAQTVTLMYW